MSMSIPYESSGRRGQKARTRAVLVEATRRLLTAGRTPTVEAAAASAGISRATAYRYFPNQRALLAATYPHLSQASLLPPSAPTDVEARLEVAVREFTKLVEAHEPELRTMLRLTLEGEPPDPARVALRQGRAIGWLSDALAPLQTELTASEIRRLVLAIRASTGIEALVWLTDVAGLGRPEARRLMLWTATSLLRAARADATRPRRPRTVKR